MKDSPSRRAGPPVVVCCAELTHAPQAEGILRAAFRLRTVEPTAESLARELPDADAYYAALQVRLTKELMERAPRLLAVVIPTTGLDHIDLQAAQQRNIAVLSLKDDRALLDKITATAELTWALLLACARHLPAAIEAARSGRWTRELFRGRQLSGMTLGILGCGRLGTMVADYGRAFRMKVIGCDVKPVEIEGVDMVSFGELLRRSDVLTIHIHLTPENRGLLGREEFGKMKSGAILLNTSRGAILDEAALLEAMESGRLLAAGLDVIEGEWRQDMAAHPLIQYARSHPNVIITPHIGGVTYESQAIALAAAAQKLVDWFAARDPASAVS